MTRDHKRDIRDEVSHCSEISVVPAAKSFRQKSIASVVHSGVLGFGDLTPAGVGRAVQGTRTEDSWE